VLGLGMGVAELAVTQQEDADFPHFPAGLVLLLDDALTPSNAPPPVVEENGSLLTEEI
jgi:hypothetical protein